MPVKEIDIVFATTPNSPDLVFVEVESPPGHSIKVGEWLEVEGYQVLRIKAVLPEPKES